MGSANMPPAEILKRIVRQPGDGCWLWIGSTTPTGYGTCNNRRAHLVVYELLDGPTPEGLDADHLCRVRNCVRPSHLEFVTHRENVLRGESFAAVNAQKTHCPRGHLYDEANTIVTGVGARRCRACTLEQDRERKGWSGNPAPADRTHCVNGHLFDRRRRRLALYAAGEGA